MKSLSFAAVLFLAMLTTSAFSGEGGANTKNSGPRLLVNAVATMVTREGQPEPEPFTAMWLYVANDGPESVRVPTLRPRVTDLARDDVGERYKLILKWTLAEGLASATFRGYQFVGPEPDYQFITLDKGQATVILNTNTESRPGMRNTFKDVLERHAESRIRLAKMRDGDNARFPDGPIEIVVEVSPDFAAKHDCWPGTLTILDTGLAFRDGLLVIDEQDEDNE